MMEGSIFCGKCGTAVNAPLKTICPKCKSEVADGFFFCNRCGEKLSSPSVRNVEPLIQVLRKRIENAGPAPASGGYCAPKTLTVFRESQFVCAACTYNVMVNGNALGRVSGGNSITATVTSDTATVEIFCTTVMMTNHKLRLVLRLGQNPRITFKLQYGGAINATVHDADILQQRTHY